MERYVNKVVAPFAFLKGRRVLVTGHTGFKGGWLALWLADIGADVVGYSLAPPTDPSLFEMARLSSCMTHQIGDIRDFAHVLETMQRFKPEVVFHLAAQPLVRRSYREPKETFDTNVGGTTNLLEATRRTTSVRATIVVTSDKCYENREWVFGYRENDAMGGHDPYSASKGAAELVTAAYRRSFGVPQEGRRPIGIASARAGNVIGGGDFAEDRILPDAVRAVTARQPLEVRSPNSTRPWQHVLDPLGGYLLLAEKLLADPTRFSDAFNLGFNPGGTAIVGDLVQRFYGELGSGHFVDKSKRQRGAVHEAKLLHLSCEKAQRVLGWRPIFGMDEAVRRTAAWYRDVVLSGKDARRACLKDIRAYERAWTQTHPAQPSKTAPKKRTKAKR